MHVLVIDDEPLTLDMIAMLLRFEHIETTAVENLQLAYSAINQKKPDVICCDLMMPDGGGIKLLEEKRNWMEDDETIPVVVITGSTSREMLQTALSLGSHSIVQKPFSTQQLVEAIKAAACAPVV